MAMTTCRECDQPVSTEASTCPHCGAPSAAPSTAAFGRRPPVWVLAVVGVLIVGTVVFALVALGRDEPLSGRDPAGAEACEKLAFSLERENTAVSVGSLISAGKAADLADTEAIRDSVIDPSEGIDLPAGVDRDTFLLADAKKLRAACEDEDVDMPPLKEPAE